MYSGYRGDMLGVYVCGEARHSGYTLLYLLAPHAVRKEIVEGAACCGIWLSEGLWLCMLDLTVQQRVLRTVRHPSQTTAFGAPDLKSQDGHPKP